MFEARAGVILEAVCNECGETCNPHGETPEDLVHLAREDGTECGGDLIVTGQWNFHYAREETP